jgi:acyl-CoA synthetase (AMP-forming)/AMP-acid ligase II
VEVVEARRDEAPDSTALVFGARTWTYEQLCRAIGRAVGELTCHGCCGGSRVAIVMPNRPEVVFTWFGSARLGAVVAILNPSLVEREFVRMFRQFAPDLVLVDAKSVDSVVSALDSCGLHPALLIVDTVGPRDEDCAGSAAGATVADVTAPYPDPDDLLEVVFTSGTSGEPKGAKFAHRAHIAQCLEIATYKEFDRSSSFYTSMPMFHIAGFRQTVLMPLLVGGTAIIDSHYSASRYWQTLRESGATHVMSAETMTVLLDREPPSSSDRDHQIRFFVTGGPPKLLNRVESRFGFRVLVPYGTTETGAVCGAPVAWDLPRLHRMRSWAPDGFLAGSAIGANRFRLRDELGALVELADGAEGEIEGWSPGMFSGYLDPSLPAGVTDDGWFATGDVGRIGPEGQLYFVDRKKDIIRRSGENIAAKEIEDVLLSHPGVLNVSVVGVADQVRQQAVKAVVIRRDEPGPTAEALWDWCQQSLAPFKVPRYIEFRDELPLTGSGRTVRRLLRDEPIISADGRTFDRGDVGSRRAPAGLV